MTANSIALPNDVAPIVRSLVTDNEVVAANARPLRGGDVSPGCPGAFRSGPRYTVRFISQYDSQFSLNVAFGHAPLTRVCPAFFSQSKKDIPDGARSPQSRVLGCRIRELAFDVARNAKRAMVVTFILSNPEKIRESV